MGIELDTTEGRKQYLSEKLDDLLDGINESYGTLLMEELLNRLELTIKDFNDEMKILCDQLVKKQKERQNLFKMLKSNEGKLPRNLTSKDSPSDDNALLDIMSSEIPNQASSQLSEVSDEDIPVWEKKLAKLEKK